MWSVHYIYSDQEEPDEKFFNLKKNPKKTPTKKKRNQSKTKWRDKKTTEIIQSFKEQLEI